MALFSVVFSTTDYYEIIVEADSSALALDKFEESIAQSVNQVVNRATYVGYDYNETSPRVEPYESI